MIKVKTYSLGQLGANCYLVWNDKNRHTVIIDPGDAADFLAETIISLNLKPQLLIATHAHFDHIMAVFELQHLFKIPFCLNENDLPILSYAGKSAKYWLNLKHEPVLPAAKVNRFLKEDSCFKLGNHHIKVITTPGHTPGSISLFLAKDKLLFSGDTIFKNAVGRTDLANSSAVDLAKSIKKILKLPSSLRVLPGHGRQTTLGKEKENLLKIVRLIEKRESR